jgi:hypothetical protein
LSIIGSSSAIRCRQTAEPNTASTEERLPEG